MSYQRCWVCKSRKASPLFRGRCYECERDRLARQKPYKECEVMDNESATVIANTPPPCVHCGGHQVRRGICYDCFWKVCRHCRRRKPGKRQRGLCDTCYRDASIRSRYPKFRQPKGRNVGRCRACGEKKYLGARRLCRTCYANPKVKAKFGPLTKAERRESQGPDWSWWTDPRPPAVCGHEIPDGLCPQCEREQRAAMGVLAEEPECNEMVA